MNSHSENFHKELAKMLEMDSDDEDERSVCQITSLPLTDKHVILECGHTFNYVPLYTDLCKQVLEFDSHNFNTLSFDDYKKIKHSNADYFIRCPYCRHIQFEILPYYEEFGLKKRYGINSLDTKLPRFYPGDLKYSFRKYGKIFKCGLCGIDGCTETYVASSTKNSTKYCSAHYAEHLETYKTMPVLCNAILKSGSNKGHECGHPVLKNTTLCKRHYHLTLVNT
jgi:hypothetical protein